jgi:hypothetical protein
MVLPFGDKEAGRSLTPVHPGRQQNPPVGIAVVSWQVRFFVCIPAKPIGSADILSHSAIGNAPPKTKEGISQTVNRKGQTDQSGLLRG